MEFATTGCGGGHELRWLQKGIRGIHGGSMAASHDGCRLMPGLEAVLLCCRGRSWEEAHLQPPACGLPRGNWWAAVGNVLWHIEDWAKVAELDGLILQATFDPPTLETREWELLQSNSSWHVGISGLGLEHCDWGVGVEKGGLFVPLHCSAKH